MGRGDSWIHGGNLFSRDNSEVDLQWIECRRILEKSEIKRDLWGNYSRFQSGRVCNVQCACLDIMQKLHWLRALINTRQRKCKPCRLHVVANEIFVIWHDNDLKKKTFEFKIKSENVVDCEREMRKFFEVHRIPVGLMCRWYFVFLFCVFCILYFVIFFLYSAFCILCFVFCCTFKTCTKSHKVKCTDGEGGDAVPRSSGNGKQVANDGSGERRWKQL